MKRILTFFLALTMVLSLAACGGKADDNKGKTEVTMTAQEIMDTLKEKLGDSFGCDVAEAEDNISGYWGLDMEQVESWASMSNSNSAVNSSKRKHTLGHRLGNVRRKPGCIEKPKWNRMVHPNGRWLHWCLNGVSIWLHTKNNLMDWKWNDSSCSM